MSTIVPGELVAYSPNIRRLTQNNPGPFTGSGTNTHLVGQEAVWILDPGVEDEAHLERLTSAVGEARVLGILPTHSHRDHWPLAPVLGARFGAPTYGFAELGGYRPDELLADGDVLRGPGTTLRMLHTPGHASDHLCVVFEEEGALFSGDLVMGWSTSVIAPPDGNLNHYMSSLERLKTVAIERMYPAHGLPIEDAIARIDELYRHRQERTEQALAAMADGLETIPEMVARIYADIDVRMHVAAGWSLLAHLDALVQQGRVERQGDNPPDARYRLVEDAGQ